MQDDLLLIDDYSDNCVFCFTQSLHCEDAGFLLLCGNEFLILIDNGCICSFRDLYILCFGYF